MVTPNNNTHENKGKTPGFSLPGLLEIYGDLYKENIAMNIATAISGELHPFENNLNEVLNYGAKISLYE